jgi:hypothetical protein
MVHSIGLHVLRHTLQYGAMTRRICMNTVIRLVTPRSLAETYQDYFGGNSRIL